MNFKTLVHFWGPILSHFSLLAPILATERQIEGVREIKPEVTSDELLNSRDQDQESLRALFHAPLQLILSVL